ncbi:hypothetical protein [Mixta sp. Marseille-Q2659]|uniref:hypothetical protein n=1 Tax=Mixta sp. Marseille-Q2659 TaxID=2736607 RepID=UPI0023B9CEB8|nr:hypothetical protein [Mixta sp. Marseille-Q2659]
MPEAGLSRNKSYRAAIQAFSRREIPVETACFFIFQAFSPVSLPLCDKENLFSTLFLQKNAHHSQWLSRLARHK